MTFDLRRLIGPFLSLPLLAAFARGEETRTPVADAPPAASSGARELEEARAYIATLEARITQLESERSGTQMPAGARGALPAQLPREEVSLAKEEFRFLDLGVRKSYIAAESDRLIDQIHTMIPPLYEPAFSPLHAYTLPSGAFRVALDSDRFTNNHDFGRDEVYARFFDNVKVETQQVDLDLFYGLDPNDTLRVTVPFRSTIISGDGKAFRIQPMVMTMNGQGYGVGDVQIAVKRKWVDQAEGPANFATVLGVQLPTGRHDRRFNDSQMLTVNSKAMPVSAASGGPAVDLFSDDLRIPNSAQPGTGSWGAIVGVTATRQLTWNGIRGAIHAGVLYKAMTNNPEGVRPGNELIFTASYVRPPLPSDYLTFDLTLLGRSKQSERYPGLITHPEADENGMPIMNPDGTLKMFTTPRPPFEHGTVMFLAPSLVVLPKASIRLALSPMFRIYEPKQGPSPAFRLVFAATSTF